MNVSQLDHDQMVLLPHQYCDPDGIYAAHFVPDHPQGAAAVSQPKPRRRRRKNKEGAGEGVMRKRKLSEEQVSMLETSFGNEHKLESERKDRLASELGLDPRQVAVWFQNRRARWKTKKLEEEYSKLKSLHDTAVLDKCRLETQLVKLKEQLTNAEREIQRLTEPLDGFSSNSPSSSFSMEAIDHPPYFGEFGMDGLDGVLYGHVADNHNVSYAHGMEWDGLYIM